MNSTRRPRKAPPKLDTRSARAKLAPQDKPYYVDASRGVDLGFRKPRTGAGSWYVRCLNGEGGYWVKRFGGADDVEAANGLDLLSYGQAMDLARKIARGETTADDAGSDKPLTVDAAVDQFEADLKGRGGNKVNATQIRFHMTRRLGSKVLALTAARDWREWRDSIMAAGKVTHSTVNRIRKSVVAMCNLAAKLDPRVAANSAAWVRGFEHLPGADQAREGVILDDDTVRKIVSGVYAAAGDEVGRFIEVLAQTGCRASQASRLNVGDVLDGNRLHMPGSKKGKGTKLIERKPIPISADLARRLREAAGDRGAAEPLFPRPEGRRFVFRDYATPFGEVVASLGLDARKIGTYSMRHSAIVRALLANVPTRVVASNVDSSIQMIERSYSRFISDHSDAVARRSLLDFAEPAAVNVVPLSPRRP
jgi:integrase